MAYFDQANLSRDADFLSRVAACAAVEVGYPESPTAWAEERIWWIAAAPGFADAYAYALATNVERPGADPAVITDGMILSAVQAQINLETPPEQQPQAAPQTAPLDVENPPPEEPSI